jgi:hypothetical protein
MQIRQAARVRTVRLGEIDVRNTPSLVLTNARTPASGVAVAGGREGGCGVLLLEPWGLLSVMEAELSEQPTMNPAMHHT